MEWLNYYYLFYYLGGDPGRQHHEGLRGGAPRCPTISTQLRGLEDQLGEKLLSRSGRSLVPTEMGGVVFRYAEDILRPRA